MGAPFNALFAKKNAIYTPDMPKGTNAELSCQSTNFFCETSGIEIFKVESKVARDPRKKSKEKLSSFYTTKYEIKAYFLTILGTELYQSQLGYPNIILGSHKAICFLDKLTFMES